jgi:CRISPR-associated protein Csc2
MYVGSEEGPANLELTRGAIKGLVGTDEFDSWQDVVRTETLSPDVVADHVTASFENTVDSDHLGLERVPDDTVDELLAAATDESFIDVLTEQREQSRAFLDQAE